MTEEQWTTQVAAALVGRTITSVQYVSRKQCREYGWYRRPIMLILDNGEQLIPTQDDEGNNGGAIATSIKELSIIPVLR